MTERQTITPSRHDLGGGFMVRRALPSARQRRVGPFVFFDHFGPVDAGPDDNHDVRPHPHIGLATVTYLYEGAMLHRDSTGAVRRIEPGAVNWMHAGRGVVHSERTPDDLRGRRRRSHGLQLWVGLPAAAEDDAPWFSHTPADRIPEVAVGGATVRVLVGRGWGQASPVPAASPTLLADLRLEAGAALELPEAAERAVYGVDAGFALDGQAFEARTLVVLAPGERPTLTAARPARIALVGGDPIGERFVWWNFVASERARIARAAAAWRDERFDPVPGETERIPLPDRAPPA